MPKTVLNVSLTPSSGKYNFDSVKKLLTWEVGRIDASKMPNLRGNVILKIFSSGFTYEIYSFSIDFLNKR